MPRFSKSLQKTDMRVFVKDVYEDSSEEYEEDLCPHKAKRACLVYDESDGETYGVSKYGRVCHRTRRFVPKLVERNEFLDMMKTVEEEDEDEDEDYEDTDDEGGDGFKTPRDGDDSSSLTTLSSSSSDDGVAEHCIIF